MKIKEIGRLVMNTLFGPVPEISNEEFDKYRDEHPVETYTLLDVRQPKEYVKHHIPGAKLIPLPDLAGRIDEVDSSKPVIAYCAIGGRSRAAAEFLAGRGYREVYSLKGGIKGWEGVAAQGPQEGGMALFRGDETPAHSLAIAYGLEAGLGNFYREVAAELEDQATADLLLKLAEVETAHKDKVLSMFEAAGPGEADRKLLTEMAASGLVEGGYQVEVLMTQQGDSQPDSQDVLDLAMTIEAQAMDLYMRLSETFEDQAAKDAMLELSEDEQKHLGALAKLREEQTA